MTLAALFSALHLLALAIGLPSAFLRARALGDLATQPSALGRVLAADNVYGVAALLWIGTGLTRLFAQLDKGLDFYLYSGAFWAKMGLFGLVFALELWPMVSFIRWRVVMAKGGSPDTRRAALFARLTYVETGLIVVMVFVAASMARGAWLFA